MQIAEGLAMAKKVETAPLNQCRWVGHRFDCVWMSLPAQRSVESVSAAPHLGTNVGIPPHQSPECTVKAWRLVAVTEPEQLVGTRSANVVSNDMSLMSRCRACRRFNTSTALCLAINHLPPVLPSTQIRR